MKPIVNLIKLGRMPYVEALNVQRLLFDKLKNSLATTFHKDQGKAVNDRHQAKFETLDVTGDSITIYNPSKNHFPYATGTKIENSTYSSHRNSLILVEHEPVYTIGIRTKDYDDNYLVKLKKQLYEHNLSANFVKTDRGGLITFHGPGQLVAYPIIYLGDFSSSVKNKSVRAYVNTLEATIIDTLSRVGLPGAHSVLEYPGVWLGKGERKIAFIGISCKRFVTMHGISINCDCDLSWFDHIVSCGIEDKMITSVHQELRASKNQHDTSRIVYNRLEEPQAINLPKADFLHPCKDAKSQANLINRSDAQPDSRQKLYPSVEDVANAFCHSFSEHFDCCIIDNNEPKNWDQ